MIQNFASSICFYYLHDNYVVKAPGRFSGNKDKTWREILQVEWIKEKARKDSALPKPTLDARMRWYKDKVVPKDLTHDSYNKPIQVNLKIINNPFFVFSSEMIPSSISGTVTTRSYGITTT